RQKTVVPDKFSATLKAELMETSEHSPRGFHWSDLMDLTKARLSVLVVFTALFGYLVAVKGTGLFSWGTLFHLGIGTVLAAFGAAVFNQLMEADADAKMERTADRPLPGNRMPKAAAFLVGFLLSAFGVIHLGMMVNSVAAAFGAGTLLVYLFIYTPLKRRSSINTILGGVSGALPPLIGWAGGDGPLWSMGALFLFAFLFLWQMPHFAAINWMYRHDYQKCGFKMWSNGDESGRKTASIALFFSILLAGLGFLLWLGACSHIWAAAVVFLLGCVAIWLSLKFLRSGERGAARTLFFYTLMYLPIAMIVIYIGWIL
ncbi:MAG: heme o synthase, partial [Verrucomicrobiota bacterium]